jgi:GT2 family glycosyltransferase
MISIILPAYDPNDSYVDAGILPRLLEKTLRLEGEWELIIVNNNAPGPTKLRTYLKSVEDGNRIKVVDEQKNLGTSGGFNAGLKAAHPQATCYIFMSSDADIVDYKILGKIEQAFNIDDRIGIIHPYSVLEDSNEYNINVRFSNKRMYSAIKAGSVPTEVEPTDSEVAEYARRLALRRCTVTGYRSFPLTFAAIRRTVIDRIGSFDLGVELVCHENDDLAFRTLKAGFVVGRLNCAFINHRRLTVRNLSLKSEVDRTKLPHIAVMGLATDWWMKKYKKPYLYLYVEWKYGKIFGTLLISCLKFRKIVQKACGS